MERDYFAVKAACTVGIPAAVLLQRIFERTERARENGERHYDGRFWYPASVSEMAVEIRYMTVNQIRNALEKLINGGYVVTGNYNVNPYDRTTWYALTDAGRALLE